MPPAIIPSVAKSGGTTSRAMALGTKIRPPTRLIRSPLDFGITSKA